ncbi:MAG: hypothetical protein LBP37_00270 [Spirochaetaceae bacterium]|jgi:hypothetical protein|nr:hypothetical protein [Spirochaetaceae bacterium]
MITRQTKAAGRLFNYAGGAAAGIHVLCAAISKNQICVFYEMGLIMELAYKYWEADDVWLAGYFYAHHDDLTQGEDAYRTARSACRCLSNQAGRRKAAGAKTEIRRSQDRSYGLKRQKLLKEMSGRGAVFVRHGANRYL